MKLETRIIRDGERRINIKEVEDIYDSDRNDALREFFADSSVGMSDRDFLTIRGGLLG